ncbi:hypothetical protein LCGC14_1545510 [marine sediment metagenome]|uniref:Uncharacterized protein n=1 Tax=marine sediment metagenome TaxID=412755 RepID=A0A0F9LSL9_9ZZZZ
MKLKCHLYSPNADCKHCAHQKSENVYPDSSANYCSIIASDVEDDYFCDFYIIKTLEGKEKIKTKKL